MLLNYSENLGLVLQNELSGWSFNEQSKGIYACCVFVEKTEDLVSFFSKIFEPLYKHKDIHVRFLAEANKVRTVKITLQLDFKLSFSVDLFITCKYLSQETEKGEPEHHCFSVWLWESRGQPGAPGRHC